MTHVQAIATPILPSGPRERAMEDGIASLGDAELLAVLLGTGLAGRPATVVAAALLERAGGLDGLGRLAPAAVAEHPGIGLAKALRIAAGMELGRRTAQRAARPRAPLQSSADVSRYARARIGPLDHEELWILALDGRNNVRGARRVAQGGLHNCSVSVRDVLRAALLEAASTVVLVHNHPSGDPVPSVHDIELTRAVSSACAVLGVPLVDHVIVTAEGRWSSMLDLGILQQQS